MNHAAIFIHIVALDAPHDVSCLTTEEKQRAAAFHHERDRRLWSASRAALRQILGKALGLAPHAVPLVLEKTGKPVLAAPHSYLHFNLTHSGPLALVAIRDDMPVGIDLEPNDRAAVLPECASIFLHPEEMKTRAADPMFLLETWCAKEAILKAAGTGLATDPCSLRLADDFSAVLAPAALAGYHLLRLEHPLLVGHTAFLASPAPFPPRILFPERTRE